MRSNRYRLNIALFPSSEPSYVKTTIPFDLYEDMPDVDQSRVNRAVDATPIAESKEAEAETCRISTPSLLCGIRARMRVMVGKGGEGGPAAGASIRDVY